ncbi:RES domain-containing protein [Glutamicibacter sp. MNS18]|uniref:RES domain-containing protein n=1 Tax=Glutamicibacter sp. MNS18 TaxID=2989817 RepID=UPI00223591A4|nr:RES domain-containing protein [Glutamicibacter sp. MNS18]MCW4466513.1 RES domain-containing protein [Glutamicibacter sp. MNS18]
MSTIVEEVDGQPSIVHAPLNGYRIAAESYGALNPIERDHFFPDDVGSWNRFDTTGRTLYAASTRNGAFSECLYSYRLDSSARTAIGFMAERFGLTEDEAYNLYADEQESLGHDRPGGFPANWREGRRLYHLSSTQDLTWFDLSTTHSLQYIDKYIGPEIYRTCGVKAVDLSHLFGPDRKLTTLIASRLRNLRLEDGSFADGVSFTSRHGAGNCWAFWMRRTDDEMDHELVTSDVGSPNSTEDPDLLDVTSRFNIRVN